MKSARSLILILTLAVLFSPAAVFCVTLYQTGHGPGPGIPVRTIPLPASRGKIYDRKGSLLACNLPSFDLYLVPDDLSGLAPADPLYPNKELVIAIDAGHGGVRSGAVGPRGAKEKDVVLAVAKKVAAGIRTKPGMRAIMTRENDTFKTLDQRVTIVRQAAADLLISIHAGFSRDRSLSGSSVYIDILPTLRDKIKALRARAAQRGIEFFVVSDLRTDDEQIAFFSQGRDSTSRVNYFRRLAGLPPIGSGENKVVTQTLLSRHQFGEAVDVAVVRNGKIVWDLTVDLNKNNKSDYDELGELGESVGLVWGGRFTRRDPGHFELRPGQTEISAPFLERFSGNDPWQNLIKESKSSSLQIAEDLVVQLGKAGSLLNREPKRVPYDILSAVEIPSVLIELDFISHPEREQALTDPGHQAALANAVVTAIDNYYSDRTMKDLVARLCRLVGADPQEIRRRILLSRRFSTGGEPVLIRRNLTFEEIASIRSELPYLPGIRIESGEKRHYVFGGLASHLIGFTGEVRDRQLELGAYPQARAGDVVGQFGAEETYDHLLRGQPGHRIVEVDAAGREGRVLEKREPVPGNDLYLTIDLELQKRAETALGGKRGGIVAIDPWTGEILALASHPAFDPEQLSGDRGLPVLRDLLKSPNEPIKNRVIQGEYPPGSVFKLIVAAAMLETNKVPEDFEVECRGSAVFYNHTFREIFSREGHGRVKIKKAIAESCNVFFYTIGDRLGIDTLADYARSFGLGRLTEIPLAGEKRGLVPTPEWKRGLTGQPWLPGETIGLSIGHAGLTTTPLQMTMVMSTIAAKGQQFRPSILHGVKKDGERMELIQPVLTGSMRMKERTFSTLLEGMEKVVMEETGTGRRARMATVKIGGKTGTSKEDHAWFAALAPIEDPQIVVVALVENGGSGGAVAAPVAGKIFDEYFLNVCPTCAYQRNSPKRPVQRAEKKALISIVMDELGDDLESVRQILSLPGEITLSIMPGRPHTRMVSELARRNSREMLLHLPTESRNGYGEPVSGRLTSDMSQVDFLRTLRDDLNAVPGAVGVNNHEGSFLTTSRHAMEAVMTEIKTRNLFFLDSRTTANLLTGTGTRSLQSVAYDTALDYGLKAAKRDLFLDIKTDDPEYVAKQLEELVQIARKKGHAVGIGHPHPATITALRKWLGTISGQGIEIVPVSRLCVKSDPTETASPVIFEHGIRTSRKIALTFDACPTSKLEEYDDKLVDVLIREQVPATLFMSGRWVEKNPGKAKFLASQPQFEIAAHSYYHPHMIEKTDERDLRELNRTQVEIRNVTGKTPIYFRPPFGEADERVARLAADTGLITVQYDIASGDADPNISRRSLVRWVLSKAQAGSIVVFHMNRNTVHTAEALPEIIYGLRKKGFKLVTVGELLGKKREENTESLGRTTGPHAVPIEASHAIPLSHE